MRDVSLSRFFTQEAQEVKGSQGCVPRQPMVTSFVPSQISPHMVKMIQGYSRSSWSHPQSGPKIAVHLSQLEKKVRLSGCCLKDGMVTRPMAPQIVAYMVLMAAWPDDHHDEAQKNVKKNVELLGCD